MTSKTNVEGTNDNNDNDDDNSDDNHNHNDRTPLIADEISSHFPM